MSRLIEVEDNSGTTSYTLHANGNPLVIDVLGNSVSFTYDNYGRRTAMNDPSRGTTTYEYDTAGNVSEMTDANGNETQMTYDKYGRMTSKQNGDFTTSYTYNNTLNKLTSVSSTNGTAKLFTYDSYGRLTVSKENATNSIWFQQTHSYDTAGRLASTAYLSDKGTLGSENFTYQNNNVYEVRWDTTSIFRQDGIGNIGYPSSVYTGLLHRTYGYSSAGQPTARVVLNGSTQVMNQTYSYHSTTGNLITRSDILANKTENFSYDSLDRLTQYGTSTVTYDDYGNITTKSDVGSYAYNNYDKPFAVTDVALSNNTLSSLGTQTISYTSFNRPASITVNNYTANYTYNDNYERTYMRLIDNSFIYRGNENDDADAYDNDRIAGGVMLTRYYLGGRYEYETGSDYNSTERLYLNGDYYSGSAVVVKSSISPQLRPVVFSKLYFICRDHLGSITHVFKSDGTLQQKLSYDAWGRLRNPQTHSLYAPDSEPTLFLGRGYCGHEHIQELGIINMNARLYDPYLGRFLSPDNYVQLPDFSQSFNRYSYCLNNPMKYTDPEGNFFIGTILSAVTDFIGNLFNHGFNVSQYDWDRTINAWRIDMSMFRGDLGQILNKWTWGIVQSGIGNTLGHVLNILGQVDDVSHMDGMVALSGITKKGGAFTIGHYSFGPDGYEATWKDHLFVHEYGHYLQSLDFGPFYIPFIGIPSLVSASGITGLDHNLHWYEVDASRRGARYFDKKYGSGKEGYTYYNPDYFDIDSFEKGGLSPYINPRRNGNDQGKGNPISGSSFNIFDILSIFLI